MSNNKSFGQLFAKSVVSNATAADKTPKKSEMRESPQLPGLPIQTGTELYVSMYKYGYDIACRNNDAYMMADMLKKNAITKLEQYEIACKHNNADVLDSLRDSLDPNKMFVIACNTGNKTEAMELYELYYLMAEKISNDTLFNAFVVAYESGHHDIISGFDEIYELDEKVMSDLLILNILEASDINVDLATKLISYVDFTDSATVSMFFEARNDVRVIENMLSLRKMTRHPCFINACLWNNEKIVNHLRDSCRWHNNSALEMVCKQTKNLRIVDMLADYGADNLAECKAIAVERKWLDAIKVFESFGF